MSKLTIPEGMSEKEYYETLADESAFLAWYKSQDLPKYETPSVTADMVAYCFAEGRIRLLVIKRRAHPYQNKYALVGGFVDRQEDAYQACIREVKEEVGLTIPLEKVEQLLTVSTPGRDPRGWVITIAHLVYLPAQVMDQAAAGDDAKQVMFLDVDFKTATFRDGSRVLTEDDFAFDHYQILLESIKRIQGRLDWNPTFLHLLEQPFTVYEGTELVNLISPRRPIVSNNFLVKFGHYLEEAGVKRVPKKKPRKVYRLKGDPHGQER
ncbi:NUDIX domain-containing protein [Streptococcus panodentis]|uniref:DNA mismatch repair protein MutT n=1 Tax=Streptococcus panodentis TaxID=1581472 RepID=A0ABS5AWU0_9STRE|nr:MULTISPECIES: NUDIX hydrolase [Streptococcus]KXT85175.1 Nudix-related transcriptional regulator NrtR [Streptococcus sp. DD11]MBP2620711.1 DNA mismatch repair protein MutT [Streptococcus panodentis]